MSLKPFNWDPILASEYGTRFNQALDSGSLSLHKLSLPERIAMNQLMENRSIEYIDAESGSLIHKERGLTMDQLLAVQTTGQWQFRSTHYGRGNYTLLLVGNSHADQIAQELSREWIGQYSTFTSFTIGSKHMVSLCSCHRRNDLVCLPLDIDYGWPRLNEHLCAAYARAVMRLVEEMKPDLLFINFL